MKWEAVRAALYTLAIAVIGLLLATGKVDKVTGAAWLSVIFAVLALGAPILALFNVPFIKEWLKGK